MQITRQAEYAIRIMLELASLEKNEVTQNKIIADRRKIPDHFLQKTIQVLVRNGMAKTRRGAMGGVQLACSPESVTLIDIIRAVEGEINISPCLAGSYYCGNKEKCQVTIIFQRAQERMLEELSKETLAELSRADHLNQIVCMAETD